ncbi:MAG: hypothetical protein NTX50_22450, partial [Candidatus Sumerlaeota bacterium]|nr:hypothetical protein [Candidatus Sumerlaeota bacterium]
MPRHLLPYCATYLLCALAAPASSAQPTSNTLIRFDFESGDMQGWKVVEGEFGALLSDQSVFWNDRSQPYNKQGKWFLSTLWSTEKKPNDRYKGVIESPVFKLLGPRMTFLVGGGSHDNTYVALCAANGNESLKACGANSEKMQRITWDAPNLVGRNVFLRIMDENEGGWGHVTFDDFTAQGILDPRATQRHFAAVAKKRISTLAQDVSLPALRRAIEDIAATYPGQYPGAYLKQLAEFENLLTKAQSQMAAQDAPGAQAGGAHERMDELMERIRAFQREALLANPLVCSKPILYISRRQYKSDHHNTET